MTDILIASAVVIFKVKETNTLPALKTNATYATEMSSPTTHSLGLYYNIKMCKQFDRTCFKITNSMAFVTWMLILWKLVKGSEIVSKNLSLGYMDIHITTNTKLPPILISTLCNISGIHPVAHCKSKLAY